MNRVEKLIKEYLKRDLSLRKAKEGLGCYNEQILIDYIGEELGRETFEAVDDHIARCSFCLSQLELAYQAHILHKGNKFKPAPRRLVKKAQSLIKSDKASNAKKAMENKVIKKNLYLALTAIFFLLSFLIPRYFMQFLFAALILGIRWAFESESGRTLIMIFDAWRRHSNDKDDEISRRLKDRFTPLEK